jgi:hypothetical protein
MLWTRIARWVFETVAKIEFITSLTFHYLARGPLPFRRTYWVFSVFWRHKLCVSFWSFSQTMLFAKSTSQISDCVFWSQLQKYNFTAFNERLLPNNYVFYTRIFHALRDDVKWELLIVQQIRAVNQKTVHYMWIPEISGPRRSLHRTWTNVPGMHVRCNKLADRSALFVCANLTLAVRTIRYQFWAVNPECKSIHPLPPN